MNEDVLARRIVDAILDALEAETAAQVTGMHYADAVEDVARLLREARLRAPLLWPGQQAQKQQVFE